MSNFRPEELNYCIFENQEEYNIICTAYTRAGFRGSRSERYQNRGSEDCVVVNTCGEFFLYWSWSIHSLPASEVSISQLEKYLDNVKKEYEEGDVIETYRGLFKIAELDINNQGFISFKENDKTAYFHEIHEVKAHYKLQGNN